MRSIFFRLVFSVSRRFIFIFTETMAIGRHLVSLEFHKFESISIAITENENIAELHTLAYNLRNDVDNDYDDEIGSSSSSLAQM